MKTEELYQKAFARHGKREQLIQAIEEFSELIQIICKITKDVPLFQDMLDQRKELVPVSSNNYHLIDEVADAQIMIDQISQMFGLAEAIKNRMQYKHERLQRRLAQ